MKIQWNKVVTPSFIVAAMILLISLLGMSAAMRQLGLFLVKQPLPLRRSLDDLADRFGPYVLKERVNGFGGGARRLKPEEEDALGTKQYITWIFRDERLRENQPGSLIRLHVPYYTGTIDSVPHVPDRCVVAGGGTAAGFPQQRTVTLASDTIHTVGKQVLADTASGSVALPGRDIKLTIVTFAQPDDQSKTFCVAYFFVANNDYVPTPEGVRFKAFNLTDKYAYFCKIEVMPLGIGDVEATEKSVSEFLSYALPEIMLCLPDWAAAQQGRVKPRSVAAGN
ncbi:MAG: hypothetical protein ACYC26_13805 [Phycisphaerales bacterium]